MENTTSGMVRRFVHVIGIIIVLALLLTVIVPAAIALTDDIERAEDAPLLCLALVGGPALLAGAVWAGELRRMPS